MNIVQISTLKIEGGAGSWDLLIPAECQIISENPYLVCFVTPTGLKIIASAAFYNCVPWIHASCSRESEMPSYDDLKAMHALVFGTRNFALQVFAPDSQHVNIHEYCLHLWGPIDPTDWPLPDFTMGGNTI